MHRNKEKGDLRIAKVWKGLIAGLLGSALLSGAVSASEPIKVFILSGQSNMQGHAHVRTMDAMRHDPELASILEKMRDSDGEATVCDNVWISSIGSSEDERVGRLTAGYGPVARGPKFGPEFTFGLYIQEAFPDSPILLIKTAWGGKSLNTDFRPPSSGTYEFSETQLKQLRDRGEDVEERVAQRKAASGRYYRLMMEHVTTTLENIERVYPEYDEEVGYEFSGFVWFQGWNDMVDGATYPNRSEPGGYDRYSTLMAQFIRDVREDLEAPELPFVIGVLGVGGPVAAYPEAKRNRYGQIHQGFRDAMAAPTTLPEFDGNVAAVRTENYWDMEMVALRERESAIKPMVDILRNEVRDSLISRETGDRLIEKFYTQTFDERELDILRNSASNAAYHYLGSARIMGPIGKGFAEAMAQLIRGDE